MINVTCDRCQKGIDPGRYIANVTVQEVGSDIRKMYNKKDLKQGTQRTRIYNHCKDCAEHIIYNVLKGK